MMENKKRKSLSIAALIVSLLPAATLLPAIFKITLSEGVRTALTGLNIVFVLVGLLLSAVCVRNKESRSIINIISTVVSVLWVLMLAGIIVLALFINFAS